MPIVLIGLPHAVHWLFPQANGAIEGMGILLPIAAFFIRLVVGLRHIRANQCGPLFRNLQQLFLFVGILSLVVVDACLILQLNIPGAAVRAEILTGFLLVTGCIYLPCMIVAMYPGREPIQTSAIGNWDVEC